MMKIKRGVKTICFLLVFILLFCFMSSLFASNSTNTRTVKGLYAEKQDTLDVIFVGASSVKTNIISPLLYRENGFTSYSMSFDGTSFVMLLPLVKEILRSQSPKVIFVDLRPVLSPMTNQRARAVIDNIKMSDNKKDIFKKYASDDNKISLYFSLEKNHSRWKDISSVLGYSYQMLTVPFKFHAFDQFNFKDIYIDKINFFKGSTINYESNPQKIYKDAKDETSIYPVDEGTEKAVYEFMNFSKENNLNVVFFVSPYFPSEKDYKEHSPQKINYVKTIIEKSGYKCLDFRSNENIAKIGIDCETDFIDTFHMNTYGAYKYTMYLSNIISKSFDLPDHRKKANQQDCEIDNTWQKSVRLMNKALKNK